MIDDEDNIDLLLEVDEDNQCSVDEFKFSFEN